MVMVGLNSIGRRLEMHCQLGVGKGETLKCGFGLKGASRRWFRLEREFVDRYASQRPPFGFNGLGKLVFRRTYARIKTDGSREKWYETVERVVNGTFTIQEQWMKAMMLGWDPEIARVRAEDMFSRIFNMKFLPPGRGLWCMGTAVTEERQVFAALNNCAFVSTANLKDNFTEPFCFSMDSEMLGIGVGFDTAGAESVLITVPKAANGSRVWKVPDSREGWVESLKLLLESYVNTGGSALEFDYSNIRQAGETIKGFGGVSVGAEPLKKLHESVRQVLNKLDGKKLTLTAIVDIMNHIGCCVVTGNVRRAAEIAFGDPESLEYIELKNYKINPEREGYGWASNNSVFARLGMDYSEIVKRIRMNGEPGIAWLDNMKGFSRMNGKKDTSDWRASGGNPCLEQTLESFEMCCLVETFPNHHDSLDDFKRTLELAFLYAKSVTLCSTHWEKTNRIMLRNRRIGCSMSGIAQFVGSRGLDELKTWAEEGYDHIQLTDRKLSDEFVIPRSIKTTCVKPSGTVSLLAGATPGLHSPESRFYIRRVRISANDSLIEELREAGYHIEKDAYSDNSMVVSFPIDSGSGVRSAKNTSMWEQLSMAAFLQKHWADNQVSCTVTFDNEKEGNDIAHALDYFQYQLKGISFLPRLKNSPYAQLPYEEISEEVFHEMSSKIRPLDLDNLDIDKSGYSKQSDDMKNIHTPEKSLQSDNKTELHNLFNRVGISQSMPDNYCESCEPYNVTDCINSKPEIDEK